MNKNILEQNHFFEKRIFEIKEKGVQQTLKGIVKFESAFIPFENITVESYEYKTFSKITLNFTIFFFIWFLIGICFNNALTNWDSMKSALICLFIAGVSLGCFIASKKYYVIYGVQNNLRLILFKNKPNLKLFNDFVNQVQGAKRQYLRSRYLTLPFNPNNSADMQRIRWLKSMGAILEEEIEKFSLNFPPNDL